MNMTFSFSQFNCYSKFHLDLLIYIDNMDHLCLDYLGDGGSAIPVKALVPALEVNTVFKLISKHLIIEDGMEVNKSE